MEKKIKEVEALLKKAVELTNEIAKEAGVEEQKAKEVYRSLRHSEDEDAEQAAHDRYDSLGEIHIESKNLSASLQGLLKYNSLFKN